MSRTPAQKRSKDKSRKRAQLEYAQREIRNPVSGHDVLSAQLSSFAARSPLPAGTMRSDGLYRGDVPGGLIGPHDFASWMLWQHGGKGS